MSESDAARPHRAGFLLAAVALLLVFAVQAGIAAHRDSVTVDEFAHLPVGLNALRTGDFRQDPLNTHLPRILAALPVALSHPEFAPEQGTKTWGLGYHFMQANAARYHTLFERARWVIIVFSLVTAALTARWALELFGRGAALVTLALFALSPSLLAHGHLVTLDMAGTLGFVLTLYVNWRFLERPSLRGAAVLGLALGFANLLKLSAFVLTAIVLVLWAVRACELRGKGPSTGRWLACLALTAGLALLVLNLGYAFDGTGSTLSELTPARGGLLERLATVAPWLRLPVPLPFAEGLDRAMTIGKVSEPTYFLAGELSAESRWYYHLVAFAAKCPLAVLLGSLAALVAWSLGRARGARLYCVFLPVLLLFAANGAFNSFNIGERHVLAVHPLLEIGLSPWIAAGLVAVRGRRDLRALAAFATAATLLVCTAAATLSVAPRYLQFFNVLAGGPEGGHEVLVDSNVDWGQDLIRLREFMQAEGVEEVSLAYFGRVDPAIYGVHYTPLVPGRSHGTLVISASFLMGRPYYWYVGDALSWIPARTYQRYRKRTPSARVGALFVFDVP